MRSMAGRGRCRSPQGAGGRGRRARREARSRGGGGVAPVGPAGGGHGGRAVPAPLRQRPGHTRRAVPQGESGWRRPRSSGATAASAGGLARPPRLGALTCASAGPTRPELTSRQPGEPGGLPWPGPNFERGSGAGSPGPSSFPKVSRRLPGGGAAAESSPRQRRSRESLGLAAGSSALALPAAPGHRGHCRHLWRQRLLAQIGSLSLEHVSDSSGFSIA